MIVMNSLMHGQGLCISIGLMMTKFASDWCFGHKECLWLKVCGFWQPWMTYDLAFPAARTVVISIQAPVEIPKDLTKHGFIFSTSRLLSILTTAGTMLGRCVWGNQIECHLCKLCFTLPCHKVNHFALVAAWLRPIAWNDLCFKCLFWLVSYRISCIGEVGGH